MVIGGAGERRVLAVVARFLLCGGGQLAGRSQLWCRVLWGTVVSGLLLLVELLQLCVLRKAGGALVELRSEEERCRRQRNKFFLNRSKNFFTLRAQVAAESGFADAVRAINNLATAQVRKDTPSLIDVKGLGRPKEFSGKEEDFQRWSKKTEAFFAGVIKESEMVLEWAAEQATEITTTTIDLEFLPTDTKLD